MNKILFVITFFLAACCSCNPANNKNTATTKDTAVGKIEVYDEMAAAIIDSNAAMEVIGKNFNWSEGPLWIAAKQVLLFSDVPENKIFQWKSGDSVETNIHVIEAKPFPKNAMHINIIMRAGLLT